MKLIAHRGNTSGPQPDFENSPLYVAEAIEKGFDVEIDVWWADDKFYLGHDKPQWVLSSLDLLVHENSWCHAKNRMALEMLLKIGGHCFWHQNDDYTLTSRNYVWTYPERQHTMGSKAVCVINEKLIDDVEYASLQKSCFAICSDYVETLKEYEVM